MSKEKNQTETLEELQDQYQELIDSVDKGNSNMIGILKRCLNPSYILVERPTGDSPINRRIGNFLGKFGIDYSPTITVKEINPEGMNLAQLENMIRFAEGNDLEILKQARDILKKIEQLG